MSDLFKKYGVTRLSKTFDNEDTFGTPDLKPVYSLADMNLANTDEQGFPNVRYIDGKPTGKDTTIKFDYTARGVRGTPGVYWQTYLSDSLVRSSIDSKHEGLVSGMWDVEARSEVADSEKAQEQAKFAKETLLRKRDHWRDFLKGWVWGDTIYGFFLWEIIDRPDGGIEKLAPRMPNTVNKWIFSEDGREWKATEFTYPDGSDVTVDAENLLLYSTGVGLDLEGISPLRSIVRWVEIKQLITQIETAAAESHGLGYKTVRADDDRYDEDDLDKIKEIIASTAAMDDPVFAFPGYSLDWVSPAGKLPAFQALRAYCDEQITHALQSTGSLLGLNNTGTYALADVKDRETLRRIRYFGQSVCDLINEHIIPRIIDNAYGGPVDGFYPQLTFAIQTEGKDPQRFTQIKDLVSAGVLSWSRDDENQIREELDLAPLPEEDEGFSEGDGEESADPQLSWSSEFADVNLELWNQIDLSYRDENGIGCNHSQHDIPDSDPEALELSKTIKLSNYDPEKLNKWIDESNNVLGKALRKVARRHRDRYVRQTAGVSDPQTITRISEALRSQFLPQYEQAVKRELNRLAVKGSASQLRELGILESKQGKLPLPSVPKDPDKAVKKYGLKRLSDQFHRHIEMQAKRIAKHSYNVTESYLENQAVRELDPDVDERLKPQIPTASAFAKTANQYTARSFNYGREQIIQRIKSEAEARGFEDTRIVLEYSSVMERGSTCQPCADADGTRVFLGSARHQKIKPPNLCAGGDRCRCIENAILPSESGYEDILSDLLSGGSQVTGYTLSQEQRESPLALIYALTAVLSD